MHTTTLRPHRLLAVALFALAALAGCRRYDTPPPDDAVPQAANISIADLHAAIDSPRVVDERIIVGGYVTSSDRSSNFHRTFTIEDPTGGMEIMAGLYDMHNIYPEGCYLTVSLEGCTLAESYGMLQAGSQPASYDYYPVGYFASRAVLDSHVRRYDVHKLVAPMPLAADELDTALCGRIVTVGPLHITTREEHGDSWSANRDGTWSGYNFFADDGATTVAVYTSAYADYAAHPAPDGTVSITGILQYGSVDGKEYFMIKMRDENDCIPYR